MVATLLLCLTMFCFRSSLFGDPFEVYKHDENCSGIRTPWEPPGSSKVRSKLDLMREFIPFNTVQDCDMFVY